MSNIVLAFENAPVTFTSDAYLNATQIAKHFNKQAGDYLRLAQTREYIEELTKTGNPVLTEKQLVIVKKGGRTPGTWLHPKLTIDFARWLSAKFAVWCDQQIENILHPSPSIGSEPPTKKAIPGGLTKSHQDEVKALVRQRADALPENKLAKATIRMWSAIKKKWGCT